MATWTILAGPREYEPSGGEDAGHGWAYELGRGAERVMVRVELSATAAVVHSSGRSMAEEAEQAIRTQGRSAVELWEDEEELPPRIVIHTEGLSRAG